MMDQARSLADDPAFGGVRSFRVGVASGLRRVPSWKRTADFVFAQMSFSVEALLRWRESAQLDVPVYAGVMVLASVTMAQRLAATIPDIEIPAELVDSVAKDRRAGVDAACEQVERLRESGAFDGVHLVPVSRYREVALRLEGRR
jgi:5,10-methylenetetrahydrofolate reductase